MRFRVDEDFFSAFDEKTGFYVRSGVYRNGRETKEDPFASSFPELLDVGIMGHCAHGSSGLCLRSGVECYQDGRNVRLPNMSLSDFESIARQCRGRTYQFALGGRGDPNQHEAFAQILEICRDNDIVPNFTTSGLGLTEEQVSLCAMYCGAVAVSWYRSLYSRRAIDMLTEAGVRTNIHFVLSRSSLPEALHRLRSRNFPKKVNALVFLLHKPVGLGSADNVIRADDAAFWELIHLVGSESFPFKIGFDSCSVPALLADSGNIDLRSLDTCEAARWSAYVTSDLKLVPCSFDQQHRWAVDLHTHSIVQAWESLQFEDFRSRFRSACPQCANRDLCLGGCPICPEIVLCSETSSRSVAT